MNMKKVFFFILEVKHVTWNDRKKTFRAADGWSEKKVTSSSNMSKNNGSEVGKILFIARTLFCDEKYQKKKEFGGN